MKENTELFSAINKGETTKFIFSFKEWMTKEGTRFAVLSNRWIVIADYCLSRYNKSNLASEKAEIVFKGGKDGN